MIGETNQSKRIELEVKRLGIFELRALAREVGVQSPTTKKREETLPVFPVISSRCIIVRFRTARPSPGGDGRHSPEDADDR